MCVGGIEWKTKWTIEMRNEINGWENNEWEMKLVNEENAGIRNEMNKSMHR